MFGIGQPFVWGRRRPEGGQELVTLSLPKKEAERYAGGGEFWWGIGNSLGEDVRTAAKACGGELPVLFSVMLSKAQPKDSNPDELWAWTHYEDSDGQSKEMPKHVLVTSRGHPKKS